WLKTMAKVDRPSEFRPPGMRVPFLHARRPLNTGTSRFSAGSVYGSEYGADSSIYAAQRQPYRAERLGCWSRKSRGVAETRPAGGPYFRAPAFLRFLRPCSAHS